MSIDPNLYDISRLEWFKAPEGEEANHLRKYFAQIETDGKREPVRLGTVGLVRGEVPAADGDGTQEVALAVINLHVGGDGYWWYTAVVNTPLRGREQLIERAGHRAFEAAVKHGIAYLALTFVNVQQVLRIQQSVDRSLSEFGFDAGLDISQYLPADALAVDTVAFLKG